MWKPKKILVPTDFSRNSYKAIHYAGLFADVFDCEITLLHVISLFEHDPNNPNYKFPNLDELYNSHESVAASEMARISKGNGRQKYKTEVARGISPADEIIRFAEDNSFDLIVLGTHGRSGLSHFFIGSVAEKVIRHQPCPVVTARYNHEVAYRTLFKRILVPVDFSNYSRHAIDYAAEIARLSGASIEVLHCIEEQVHPSYYVAGDVSILKQIPDLRDRSLDALKKFADAAIPQEIEHTYHIKEGRAHHEIVQFAEENDVDLIVMATHGLSGLDHFLMGSTTEKIIRQTETPVLGIKIQGDF